MSIISISRNWLTVKILFVVLYCLFCIQVFAQSSLKIRITRVDFIDPGIEPFIEEYIDSLEQVSDYWATGKGYLVAYLSQPSGSTASNNPVVRVYHIHPAVSDFDRADDVRFPLFYTFLAGKMCLIRYSDIWSNHFMKYTLRKSSKRRFKRLIAPFLNERKKRTPEDTPGPIKRGDKYYREVPFIYIDGLFLEIAVRYDGTMTVRQTYDEY